MDDHVTAPFLEWISECQNGRMHFDDEFKSARLCAANGCRAEGLRRRLLCPRVCAANGCREGLRLLAPVPAGVRGVARAFVARSGRMAAAGAMDGAGAMMPAGPAWGLLVVVALVVVGAAALAWALRLSAPAPLRTADAGALEALLSGGCHAPPASAAVRWLAAALDLDDGGPASAGAAAAAAPLLRPGAVPVFAHAIATAAGAHVGRWAARGGAPVALRGALRALATDLFLGTLAGEAWGDARGGAVAGALEAAAAAATAAGVEGGAGGRRGGSPPRLWDLLWHWRRLAVARDGVRAAVRDALRARIDSGGAGSLSMAHPETHGAGDVLGALRGMGGGREEAAAARGLRVLHAEHAALVPVLAGALVAVARDAGLVRACCVCVDVGVAELCACMCACAGVFV